MLGFEVFTSVSMKMTVFWVVAPSLVQVYERFRAMEAASTSETSANFYQTLRYNPEDRHHKRIFIYLFI
jgi:hypothetical protein